MAERVLGLSPAFILFTNQVFDGPFDVVKPDLAHLMAAVQHDDRAHADAGTLHLDQQDFFCRKWRRDHRKPEAVAPRRTRKLRISDNLFTKAAIKLKRDGLMSDSCGESRLCSAQHRFSRARRTFYLVEDTV